MEVPKLVSNIISTCSQSAGRSIFLAGFSFYQIGRYDFTSGYDKAYIILNTISFVLSVMSAALSTFVQYYMERSKTNEYKIAFVRFSNGVFVRGSYQCFSYATVTYCLGLSRIGYVYYRASILKLIPEIIFTIAAVILYLAGPYSIVVQLSFLWDEKKKNPNEPADFDALQTPDEKRDVKRMVMLESLMMSFVRMIGFPGLLTSAAFVFGFRRSQIPGATSETSGTSGTSGSNSVLEGNPRIVDQFLYQANIISSRAVYVAGMAQNAVLRFIATDADNTSAHKQAYLVCASLATGLALIAAMLLSNLAIFVKDTPTKLQMRYTCFVLPVAVFAFWSYFFSFIFLFLTIALMPWGCSYQSMFGINVTFGTVSLVVCLCGVFWLHSCYKETLTVVDTALVRKSTAIPNEKVSESDEAINRKSNQILSQLNHVGAQATLASAFVWYNIDTLKTDVIDLPYLDFAQSWRSVNIFLFVNIVAITAGLCSAILDQMISSVFILLPTAHHNLFFLRRMRGLIVLAEMLFYVALTAWFLVFASIGLTKFEPASYAPAGYACVGAACTIAGVVYLEAKMYWANTQGDDPDLVLISVEEQANLLQNGTESKALERYLKRPALLIEIGYNVLFLGGFAYNAVVFFNFQNGVTQDVPYLHLMCLSFNLSLILITWGAFYNIKANSCRNNQVQFVFAKLTETWYYLAVTLAALVVVTLLGAFCMIGYVKSRGFYFQNYFFMAPIMAVSSAVCGILCFVICWYVHKSYTIAISTTSVSVNRTKMTRSLSARSDSSPSINGGNSGLDRGEINGDNMFAVERKEFVRSLIAQIAAAAVSSSFVAGNVCYEILFSQSMDPLLFGNYNYFIADNWTFAAAVSVVVVSTYISFLFGQIENDLHILNFAACVRRFKPILFFLSASSLFTWLYSVIWMGSVKYTGQHAISPQPDYWIGSVAVFAFLHMAVNLKLASNQLVAKENSEVNASSSLSHRETEMSSTIVSPLR